MNYLALAVVEGSIWSISFPDCPGCESLSDDPSSILREASEALDGWLETMLDSRREIPAPSLVISTPEDGPSIVLVVPVRAALAERIQGASSG